jgi:hypothetical protein
MSCPPERKALPGHASNHRDTSHKSGVKRVLVLTDVAGNDAHAAPVATDSQGGLCERQGDGAVGLAACAGSAALQRSSRHKHPGINRLEPLSVHHQPMLQRPRLGHDIPEREHRPERGYRGHDIPEREHGPESSFGFMAGAGVSEQLRQLSPPQPQVHSVPRLSPITRPSRGILWRYKA